MLARLSPFAKGEVLSVFLFLRFSVWFGVLLSVFRGSSLLRVVVWKIFGSELLFLGVGVGLVFLGGVLPMFLLYVLAVRSRNCFRKILLMSGLVFLGSFSLP